MSEPRSLGRQLFTMTWPMMFGVLSLMSFQLVDSAFIGQLGVLPLAAQGFTLPIQMIIIGIQVGLGIATTAIISRALGAEQHEYAKQLGGLIITIGAIGVALIGLVIWMLRTPILQLLSAPESVYPIIDSYWVIWLVSAWVGAMLYFGYSICRANGNTMLPGTMMVVTSVINLVLDPIFIFWLDMGINGAALATILAFGIGSLIVYPKVISKQWLSFNWKTISISNSVGEIGRIMGPAMMSQLLPPVSSMLATKLIAGFGTAAVASWAVGSRFEFFAIVVVLALTMSMPPMIGRLLGAKKFNDIEQLVTIATKFILVFQFSIAIVVFFIAPVLADWMTSEEAVRSVLDMHLTIVPFSLGPLGICMLMVSVTNALAMSMRALIISSLRLFAFFLPCLWVGATLADLYGLFWGAFVGNCLAGLTAWMVYKRAIQQLSQRHYATEQ
ncbi:MATE family efflux transporter [Thaumasiovibrio subtropicus]|uniref:MATE family efflux transporter n=1 Tax=Thaumasiovibrio subtropicus TaxID=1891207 RepID=UPI000B35FD03|nr:MATE family efflux transporter [Thaumasiovibrio subtropicus]